jgi:hypothetical protein
MTTPRLPRDTTEVCGDCGWSSAKTTAATAAYALRRHSCTKHRDVAARRARGTARRAAVDRTEKPCHHKHANHQHGTKACYTHDRCRCPPCSEAASAYETSRVKAHAYGRWDGYVSAARARVHILHLKSQGMGLKRIAAVSEVSQGQLWKLIYGRTRPDGTRVPSRRVMPTTEARILAVTLDLAGGARVDATGITRRIQAMVTIGWSQASLAGALQIGPSNFTPIVHGRRPTVTVATAKAVTDLYARLSMTPNTPDEWRAKSAANRARNYATAHGWAPPLAWDDETIDNSDALPDRGASERLAARFDQVVIDRILAGHRLKASHAEKVAVTAAWQASGRPLAALERFTGWEADRYTPDPQAGAA